MRNDEKTSKKAVQHNREQSGDKSTISTMIAVWKNNPNKAQSAVKSVIAEYLDPQERRSLCTGKRVHSFLQSAFKPKIKTLNPIKCAQKNSIKRQVAGLIGNPEYLKRHMERYKKWKTILSEVNQDKFHHFPIKQYTSKDGLIQAINKKKEEKKKRLGHECAIFQYNGNASSGDSLFRGRVCLDVKNETIALDLERMGPDSICAFLDVMNDKGLFHLTKDPTHQQLLKAITDTYDEKSLVPEVMNAFKKFAEIDLDTMNRTNKEKAVRFLAHWIRSKYPSSKYPSSPYVNLEDASLTVQWKKDQGPAFSKTIVRCQDQDFLRNLASKIH